MDAVSSRKHKRKRGIAFVIVSRYRFCGITAAVGYSTAGNREPVLLSAR